MKHFQPALKSIRQLYPVIDGVMLTSPETCEVGRKRESERCRIAGIRIMSMWRKRIRGETAKNIHGFVCLFVRQWQSTFSMEERRILWMI